MHDHATPPESRCQCTSARCRHRIGNSRHEITQILFRASLQDLNDSRNRFVPLKKLKSEFDYKAVQRLLQTFLGHDVHGFSNDEIADHVSPQGGLCQCCKDDLCTGRRIIFVTLMLLAKENYIIDFINSPDQICDSKLPIRRVVNEESQFDTDSLRQARGLSIILQGWEAYEIELFDHLQWQMRSPYFSLRDTSSDDYRQLDEQVSLPWTEVETLRQAIDLEVSTVQRVRIHEDHHNMGNNNYFGLKILDPSRFHDIAETAFKNERTSRTSHPHITALLTTFEYRNKFYLVLPWAEGGNLRQLWKEHPRSHGSLPWDNIPWYSDKWMADQCYGIADALAKVHGHSSLMQQQEDCFHQPKLHHDIKPENILCFRTCEDGMAPYVLKLTDFEYSLALGPDEATRVEKTIGSKTYRPPEADFKGSKIGHSWDIWGLGCLYLEFITWVIMGWDGVERFGNERIAEMDDRIGDPRLRPIEEDVFFRKRMMKSIRTCFSISKPKAVAEIKQTVTSHIKDLSRHPRCSTFLQDFLQYIEENMLVIGSKKRASSDEVRGYLKHQVDSLSKMTSESRQPCNNDAGLSETAPLLGGDAMPIRNIGDELEVAV